MKLQWHLIRRRAMHRSPVAQRMDLMRTEEDFATLERSVACSNRPKSSTACPADFVGRRNSKWEHKESTNHDGSSRPGHLCRRYHNRRDMRGKGKLKDWDHS